MVPAGEFLPPEPVGREPDLSRPVTHQAPNAQPASGSYAGFAAPEGSEPPEPEPEVLPGAAPREPWQGEEHRKHVAPDNGQAVGGFTFSTLGLALLVMTATGSSLVSVACGATGIFLSLRGKQAIALGETQKQAGLAQAGYVLGIASVVIGLIGTAILIAVAVR